MRQSAGSVTDVRGELDKLAVIIIDLLLLRLGKTLRETRRVSESECLEMD